MYKLNFFVPEKNKEEVKQSLFDIGVGKHKLYDHCAFESVGTGQFRPSNSANPHIGQPDKLEYVQEYKIEMICQDHLIKEAVSTLKKIHPYEEVAFEVIKLETYD